MLEIHHYHFKMGRVTEYRAMVEIPLIPSDTDFLMLCPSLGLQDKKIVKQLRVDDRRNKRDLARRVKVLLLSHKGFRFHVGMQPDSFI